LKTTARRKPQDHRRECVADPQLHRPCGAPEVRTSEGYVPEPGELRFDMFEAEFAHEGNACTFGVLLNRFGIADAALQAIAEIVHDIDIKEAKYERPETTGFQHMLNGPCTLHRDDEARIAAGITLLEAPYAHF